MTTKDYLATFGVSLKQAYDYIMANLSNAQLIHSTSLAYRLGISQLTDIVTTYEPLITRQQVEGYFTANDLSAAALDLAQSSIARYSQQQNAVATHLLPSANNLIVSSLDSDYQWQKSQLTYAFNTSIPSDYYGQAADSSLYGNLTTAWQAPNAALKNAFTPIMQQIDAIIAPSVAQSSNALLADIRVNQLPTTSQVAAFAYYPGSGVGGDVFVDSRTTEFAKGGYNYFTLVHELGHAFGLKHPFEGANRLPSNQDNTVTSVMSYTEYQYLQPIFKQVGRSLTVEYDTIMPTMFMVNDIAALHSIYGAQLMTHSENTVYRFLPSGVSQLSADLNTIIISLPSYTTIWDAGGTDTLDFSATSLPNRIDLTSGNYSNIQVATVDEQIISQQQGIQAQLSTGFYNSFIAESYQKYAKDIYTGERALGIAYGVVIENVLGGSANDMIIDNFVDNRFFGGAGDDAFYLGAGGYDYIDGGEGRDILFLSSSSSQARWIKLSADTSLLLTDRVAVELVGVEQIQFTDKLITI